jgi:hypothetical protein
MMGRFAILVCRRLVGFGVAEAVRQLEKESRAVPHDRLQRFANLAGLNKPSREDPLGKPFERHVPPYCV